MNFQKEIVEKVFSLLQDIGATDQMEFKEELTKIPDADSIIGHLPDILRSGEINLDPNQFDLVIRGICKIEGWAGNHFAEVPVRFIFGSTTVIPRLLERFGRVVSPDSKKVNDLTDWLFLNRANPYIPFGYQIPIGINSSEEYAEYEDKRAKHRADRLAIDQEAHREAVARKSENARLHAERSAANRLKRKI